MYDVRHAALPGTLMVVNIGQTEAKVESVLDTFLQLQRTSAFADDVRLHSQLPAPRRLAVESREPFQSRLCSSFLECNAANKESDLSTQELYAL